ncbi:MAG: bis-aminopropyl spermidine synthase family protein [Patescibacteria group bacterium]
MKDLVRQIQSRNPYLKQAEVDGILYLIKNTPNLSNNDLVRYTGLPKETLRQFKSSISNILTDSESDIVVLKEDIGEEFIPYKWSLLSYSDEGLQKKLSDIRTKYDLEPKREYDQFFADVKTTVSKVKILQDKGMVEDRDILLLGDDDLVSVALSLSGVHYNSITILDIDRAILDTITRICQDLEIGNVCTRVYDARQDLSEDLYGRFDIVMTDPPYTRAGIDLFLRRGVELLELGDDKYIFLCYGNSFRTPEKTLKVQEVIGSYNFLIEDKIDKFNRYYGAESIGSASSMYVLRRTPFTHVPESSVQKTIYTFEGEKEEKFPFVDHYSFKIHGVPGQILSSRKSLQKAFGEFCRIHKLKVVSTDLTKFKGQGVTMTFVLSQSNLTVHTWPEYGALHIVLVTCSPIYNKDTMTQTLSRLLSTDAIEVRRVE